MRRKHFYVVTVFGDGIFPFDMLRRDRATPESEQDSAKIDGFRSRELRVRMNSLPTEGRWNSFGWIILNVEKRFL